MIIRTIATHEIRDITRDGRFRWSAAIVAALLVAALLAGWSHQRQIAADHASAARASREAWLAQPPKDPHSAAHFGAYLFKPRGPLTLVDSGISAYTGTAVWLEAHKQNEFQFRPAQDSAAVGRFGQLTAAATLQFLVPVLIVLLAFTKFAGDREDGTLRQLIAAGVSARQLALGKFAGVAASLALAIVPAACLGALALFWTSAAGGLGTNWPRVAGLVVIYSAYLTLFVALALAVSARCTRSSHALAVLVAFWVINAVLAPRAGADLARWLHPTPTAFAMSQQVFHDTYDGLPLHDFYRRHAAGLVSRLTAEYGVDRVEDLPVNLRGIDYLEREAHSNRVWDAHYDRLWDRLDRQTRLHQMVSLAAPLLAVRDLSMAVTGTDIFHHRAFATEAEAYRRRLVLMMNEDLAYGSTSAQLSGYAAGPDLWSRLEAFEYRQPGLAWALQHAWIGASALTLWMAAAGAALWLAVRGVRVE